MYGECIGVESTNKTYGFVGEEHQQKTGAGKLVIEAEEPNISAITGLVK